MHLIIRQSPSLKSIRLIPVGGAHSLLIRSADDEINDLRSQNNDTSSAAPRKHSCYVVIKLYQFVRLKQVVAT